MGGSSTPESAAAPLIMVPAEATGNVARPGIYSGLRTPSDLRYYPEYREKIRMDVAIFSVQPYADRKCAEATEAVGDATCEYYQTW